MYSIIGALIVIFVLYLFRWHMWILCIGLTGLMIRIGLTIHPTNRTEFFFVSALIIGAILASSARDKQILKANNLNKKPILDFYHNTNITK